MVIAAKNTAGMMDDFIPYRWMALEEFIQIIMFVQIFLIIDQVGIGPQFGGNLGMVLKEYVKLANFVP